MVSQQIGAKLIVLFTIILGFIAIAVSIRIQNDSFSESMVKKNIELAQLHDAWLKMTNMIETDKRIATVEDAMDIISRTEGDDWCLSRSTRNKYRIYNVLSTW